MSDTALLIVVFGSVILGVWLSYRLFMRGDTNEERVASHLPRDFKPEWSVRHGDTYVGYESASGRLALVDYPYAAVVKPHEVRAIEAEDENVLGIVHRWLVVIVPQKPLRFRVWFGLRAGERDAAIERLKGIVTAASPR